MVRYRGGEKFGYHYDAVPPTLLGNGGQRAMTLLVYLNEPAAGGGATAFRDLRPSPSVDESLEVRSRRIPPLN